MVDITVEFQSLVNKSITDSDNNDNNNNNVHLRRIKPRPLSLFLLKAAELVEKIQHFEELIRKLHDDYVGFTRYVSDDPSLMNNAQKAQLMQEMTGFVTAFGSEIQELRRSIEWKTGCDAHSHAMEIVAYLLDRLSRFTKKTQKMQQVKQRICQDENPFRILSAPDYIHKLSSSVPSTNSGISNGGSAASRKTFMPNTDQASSLGIQAESELKLKSGKSSISEKVTPAFVARYADEIAPLSELAEYQRLGAKYKDELMKEAKHLKVKFSAEMTIANEMEGTVNNISAMLSQFVDILQEQTNTVDNVHSLAVDTTDFVKDADNELCLALERSNSHSRNMVILITGFSFLLLLLDFLTP